MSDNIETQTNTNTNEQTNEQTIDKITEIKRISKYINEEARHEAIKAQKRSWYKRNSDKQKLKSLRSYYENQLKKDDLKEEVKNKYEAKLNDINEKLYLI